MPNYCKIRFESKYYRGATGGIVFEANILKGKTITELSRYSPIGEFNRMNRLERSPFFETWNEAFNYEFKQPKKGL